MRQALPLARMAASPIVERREPNVPRHLAVPSLFPPPDYAHAVVVEAGERLVYTAGGVPLDDEGQLVGPDDRVAQTRQVLGNLDTALRASGSALRHTIRTEVYVVATEQQHLYDVWDVVRACELSVSPHASTLLGVSMLGVPGQLVEITAIAAACEAPAGCRDRERGPGSAQAVDPAGAGAVPPRWAGSHQESSGPLGRAG